MYEDSERTSEDVSLAVLACDCDERFLRDFCVLFCSLFYVIGIVL